MSDTIRDQATPPAVLEITTALDTLKKEFYIFKEVNDKVIKAQTDDKGKVAELTAKLEKVETTMHGLDKNIAEMTAKYNQPRMETDAAKAEKQKAVVGAFIKNAMGCATHPKYGFSEAEKLEFNTLSAGSNLAGGVFVQEELEAGILKGIREMSPIRTVASVKTLTKGDAWKKVKKITDAAASMVTGETGTRSETTNPAYGMERIPVHAMYCRIPLTNWLEEDAEIDIVGEVTAEMVEAMAVLEGNKAVLGTGVNEPEGVTVNAAVLAAYVASGAASSIKFDGLKDLVVAPKSGYEPNMAFLMRRATLGEIWKLKDNNGQYLWTPGNVGGKPNTLLGYPVYEFPDMAAVAANAYPIAFGDFKKGYYFIDRTGFKLQRINDSTTSAGGYFILHAERRFGGQVVVAEAIKLLKIAAS